MNDRNYIMSLFLMVVIVMLVGSLVIFNSGKIGTLDFSSDVKRSIGDTNGQAKVGLEILESDVNTLSEEKNNDKLNAEKELTPTEIDISSCSDFCDQVCTLNHGDPDNCVPGCLDGCSQMKEREGLPDY